MKLIQYEGRYGNKLFMYCKGLVDCIENESTIINHFENGLTNHNALPSIFKRLDDYQNNFYHELCIKEKFPFYDDANDMQIGFFQDKDTIDKFKKYKHILFKKYKVNEGVWVTARLGDTESDDFKKNNIPGYDYYAKILKNLNYETGYISSDIPDHDIVKRLSHNFNLKIVNLDPDETLKYAHTFQYKILGLGTYCWWVGFLGNSLYSKVFYPEPTDYVKWHGDIFQDMGWTPITKEWVKHN